MTFIDGVITASLARPGAPFTSLGGMVHQRSGVVNIALEGHILAGTFVGLIVAVAPGSGTLGLGAGVVAGAVVGWLFSVIVTRLQGNMIIVGLGINTGALRSRRASFWQSATAAGRRSGPTPKSNCRRSGSASSPMSPCSAPFSARTTSWCGRWCPRWWSSAGR